MFNQNTSCSKPNKIPHNFSYSSFSLSAILIVVVTFIFLTPTTYADLLSSMVDSESCQEILEEENYLNSKIIRSDENKIWVGRDAKEGKLVIMYECRDDDLKDYTVYLKITNRQIAIDRFARELDHLTSELGDPSVTLDDIWDSSSELKNNRNQELYIWETEQGDLWLTFEAMGPGPSYWSVSITSYSFFASLNKSSSSASEGDPDVGD